MKLEAQRIAIAEACGWYRCNKENPCGGWHNDAVGKHPNQYAESPPDYLNNLNAMHEAEKVLTKEQCYKYSDLIGLALGDWRPSTLAYNWPFHAPASHRAEAFLRTLGKWVEEPEMETV